MKDKAPQQSAVLETLRRMKPMLGEKYGVTKLGIFGSVARNEATERSDIDVVMETDKPDLFLSVHIKAELEDALNAAVDLIRYREKMNPFLKSRIDRDAIYV